MRQLFNFVTTGSKAIRPQAVLLASLCTLAVLVNSSNAAIITVPTPGSTFGTLTGATFGGSGIPNDAVAITSFTDGGNTITLGLTAHRRFSEPAVSNDGNGTFTASAGGFTGSPTLARWNFAYYIDVDGGATLSDYQFDLLYDFDPGVGTDDSLHGVIDFTAAGAPGSRIEDSQNLGFGFLQTGIPSVVIPPAFTSFDPNAIGQYTFALRASVLGGDPLDPNDLLGQTSMAVNTVPEPGTLAMFGFIAIGCVAGVRRRQRIARA